MHIWCGRRSVPRLRSQHAGNQSLSRKGGSSGETTLTPNAERSSKPKWKAGQSKQIPIQIRGEVTPFLQDPQKMYKKSDFQWTPEAEKAFQSMKECIAELPMVTAPKPREELIMYFCIAREAISIILSSSKNTRRMLKWKFELEAFDITYRPRTSISGQVLADFIAKKPDEGGPPMEVPTEETVPEPWVLFMDGSSCLEGSGAGLILTSPEGEEFTYALRFEFDASNNEAEYEALVAGLQIGEQIGVKNLITKVDSRLVANQVNGLHEAKEQSMTRYLEKAKTLIGGFKKFSIE
ncbi:reverse transcriptase domain-containing protein [Tanacetum coccineum]